MKQVKYYKQDRKAFMMQTVFAAVLEDGNFTRSIVVGRNPAATNSIETFPNSFVATNDKFEWQEIKPKEFFDNSDAAKKLIQYVENDIIDNTEIKGHFSGKPGEIKVKSKKELEDDLIDALAQMYFISKKTPGREISLAITKLQETLSWFKMPPFQY